AALPLEGAGRKDVVEPHAGRAVSAHVDAIDGAPRPRCGLARPRDRVERSPATRGQGAHLLCELHRAAACVVDDAVRAAAVGTVVATVGRVRALDDVVSGAIVVAGEAEGSGSRGSA